MPKRRSSSARRRAPWKFLGLLAAIALLVFLAGEAFAFLTSDLGRVLVYRHLHLGNRTAIVRILSRRVHEALAEARVPRAAVHEDVVALAGGGAPHWVVSLERDGSPMQVNVALTRAVQRGGAEVLSGREQPGPAGALSVTLVVGVPGRPLQEIELRRPGRAPREDAAPAPARVALVLFGEGEHPELARRLLARREPFAVAVPGTATEREALRREARDGGHELVLQVPMEPEGYPATSPGPGTLLVSMSARQIQRALRAELEEAGDVAAVANLMGSLATQDEPFMAAVYHELQRAGVTFLHVAPQPRAVCRPLASHLGAAYDEPDVVLDAEARASRPQALRHAWKAALELAERRGHAIVLLRVTPLSADWLDEALAPRTLGAASLVPLSSVVHHPDAR